MNLTALREKYDDFLAMLLGRNGDIDFGRKQHQISLPPSPICDDVCSSNIG